MTSSRSQVPPDHTETTRDGEPEIDDTPKGKRTGEEQAASNREVDPPA